MSKTPPLQSPYHELAAGILNGLHHPSWMDSSGGDEKQRRLVRRLLLASIRNCLWNSSHIQKVPDNQPGVAGSGNGKGVGGFFSRKSYQPLLFF